ncbi:MAG: MOSC domain-containing protein [Pseudomonadota bacterium]
MSLSPQPAASVVAVCTSPEHRFSKQAVDQIELVAGEGVVGDAHAGVKVKHRSRVRKNPDQPNLRQIHLIHSELLDLLRGQGFDVWPGTLGENITTQGLDLLSLPAATRLYIGSQAIIEVTGLRNPCHQLDDYQTGLMSAVLDRDSEGNLIRKSGVMGIVLSSGLVSANDKIRVEYPAPPHEALKPV